MLKHMVNLVGEHGAQHITTKQPPTLSELQNKSCHLLSISTDSFPLSHLTNQPTGTNQPTQLEATNNHQLPNLNLQTAALQVIQAILQWEPP